MTLPKLFEQREAILIGDVVTKYDQGWIVVMC
jgi:hypothetical protein